MVAGFRPIAGRSGKWFRSAPRVAAAALAVAVFAGEAAAQILLEPRPDDRKPSAIEASGQGPKSRHSGDIHTPTHSGAASARSGIVSQATRAASMKAALAEIATRWKSGDRRQALVLARAALRFAQQSFPKGHGYIGRAHQTVGDILMATGEAKEASAHYLAALVIASRFFSIDKPPYRALVSRLTRAWLQAGLADKALALYAHILKGTEQAPEREVMAHAVYRSQYGRLLRQRGRMRDAEHQHRRSLAIRRRILPKQDIKIAFALTDLGGIMRATSRFAEAEKYFLEAAAVIQATKGQEANLAILLDNLGTLYGELGRLSDAERVQRRAVALFEQALGPEHRSTAIGYANLAALYYRQRRFGEARPLFERALALYRKLLPPKDLRIGVLLDNYAGLLRAEGKRSEAAKSYAAALEVLRANYPARHPEIAKAISNLALAEQEDGNIARAIALTREAIAMSEEILGKKHLLLAAQYASLGDMFLRQRKAREAIAALEHAIAVSQATVGPLHENAIRPLRQLAGLSLGQKKYADALRYSAQAVLAERLRVERSRLDPDVSVRRRTTGAFGGSIYIGWNVAQALPKQSEVLGRTTFENAQWITLSQAGQSVGKLGARFATRNAEISALARRRQDLARAWRQADARLVQAIARPPGKADPKAVAAARAEVTRIDAELDALDAKLAAEFPAFSALSEPKPLPVTAVQALLKPNEALVQYVMHGPDVFAWAVTPRGFAWRRLDRPYKEIADRVQALRCGLDPAEWVGETRPLRCLKLVGRTMDDKGTLPFDPMASYELYATLLQPFENLIGNRHIIVVAAGALTTLPFQVLLTKKPSGKSGAGLKGAPWLIRRQAVSVLPSVAGLEALRRAARPSAARQSYLAVANPLLVGRDGKDRRAFSREACPRIPLKQRMLLAIGRLIGSDRIVVRGGKTDVASLRLLEPLPDTADEVCAVGRSLGAPSGAIMLGPNATERSLKQKDGAGELADYKILHFATHGLVSGELKGLGEPALVLSPPTNWSAEDDGLLTASEVASLKLDANWVILSACNTAAGRSLEDEALSGLARSFFYAGARSLLVSHWPVQSQAAVRLTTFALASLKRQPGLARAEALRRAMLDILDHPKWQTDLHPHVWAPFIVVGEAGGQGWSPPRRRLPVLPDRAKPSKSKLTGAPKVDWRGRVFRTDP
ncbi:MAG: CHAT domain-containing protein [Hyphomicrobiaceae bacterium]|nr:CHAT domain-containing protein [Hyphomicrobiaceae bacterium]